MKTDFSKIPTSGQIFARELWDYAGIFPPAQLPLETAFQNFMRYLREGWRVFLSTFVVPLNRLSELEDLKRKTHPEAGQIPLSLLLSLPESEVSAVDFENHLKNQLAPLEWGKSAFFPAKVEAKVPAVKWLEKGTLLKDYLRVLRRQLGRVNPRVQLFLEFEKMHRHPIEKLRLVVEELTAMNTGELPEFALKIRCGGPDATFVPAVDFVFRFFRLLTDSGLGFKATAGLHHPLNNDDKIMKTTAYGFLNFFVASMLAKLKLAEDDEIREVLQSRDSGEFKFRESGLSWREIIIDNQQIEHLRKHFAISIGSCSIAEPLEDLEKLNWFK